MQYTLSDQEVTFLSQLIYRINSLNDYEAVCQTVLRQLQTVIPFKKGIIFQIQEQEQGLVYGHPVTLNPPELHYDENTFMSGSYRSEWLTYASTPWSSTFRQTDIRAEDSFRQSELYRDIYAPQDIYYGLHSILVHQDHKLALVGLFRPEDACDFTPRDSFILSTLALHLELRLYTLFYPTGTGGPTPAEQAAQAQEDFHFYIMQKYGLTRRETEVALLMCRGKTNQEITASLFISKSTLDKHLNSVYRKMNVKNRLQLVHLLHQERTRG